MQPLQRRLFLAVTALAATISSTACESTPEPSYSYYEDQIAPVVRIGCAQQTTGCHIASPEGTAAGNLDLSSYDSLMRRKDLLSAFGPYPVGLLLMKGGDPIEIRVDTFDAPMGEPVENRFVTVTTDVRHAAGSGVRLDSNGYARLKQWIAAGHTRTGIPPAITAAASEGCRTGAGTDTGFDASVPPADTAGYDAFKADVWPIMRARCAGGACHASPIAVLYLACGDTEDELRWNFHITTRHLNRPAVQSDILRRPLAAIAGGVFHEGGPVFANTEDGDYQTLRAWATDMITRNPTLGDAGAADDGLRFFANRVQPTLVRKGCIFLNCHSPAMFHDLRLRGGSQGAFNRIATERNYEMSRLMLAMESPDPNASRIIAKNLFPANQVAGGTGLSHRGGSLFEDFAPVGGLANPATLDDCAGVDADNGDLNAIPAYCVLARWHQIERDAAAASGEIEPLATPARGIVWVSRPVDVGNPTDFDTYRPGADLVFADATVAADGSWSLGAERSLLGGCGLTVASADVRGPAVSWDGARIAFAARTSAATPYRVYWANADGSACERVPEISTPTDTDAASGLLLHDFDPAFAPDGRLVFASTRGNLDCEEGLNSCGPTRTPAAMQPNSNLYIYEAAAPVKVRQLTFLLNQEMMPSFMLDGRLVFTAEKREPDFHQLAGRRINLDGGDYHPLLAQRGQIGFESATEVGESPNRNFFLVASRLDATHGAGAIAVMNRSLGPDQSDRDPGDRAYLSSVTMVAGAGLLGRTGGAGGAFRSPAPLPNGRLIASCDLGATTHNAPSYDFELCEVDPAARTARRIGGRAGAADIEAVAVYARPQHGVFTSRPDEANGHTSVVPGARDAIVQVQDFVLLETLLFSNTRVGRPIDLRVGGLDVLAVAPPPASARSFAELGAAVRSDAFGSVYVNYTPLGNVPLNADGSAKVQFRGGTPIVLRMTDGSGTPLTFAPGAPFSGELVQREQMQFYPGERANQAISRRFFNGLCGGCHGSISGRELDIAVDVDILTGASRTTAYDAPPTDLR